MNILTEGAPKIWYIVQSKDSWKVLDLARQLFPTITENFCENFWRHKCFVMKPDLMRENGIEVVRIVQHQGEAIITLPGAFHCGFNSGLNTAVVALFDISK